MSIMKIKSNISLTQRRRKHFHTFCLSWHGKPKVKIKIPTVGEKVGMFVFWSINRRMVETKKEKRKDGVHNGSKIFVE